MKIEILMAVYNGEKYINEQIKSIINQNYSDWNLLIRDDGSSDSTVKIIRKYEKKDSRIKLLEDSKGNLGFMKNFEELLLKSSENFIMFSDQDDYWLENKLEEYVRVLKSLSQKEKEEKLLLIHSNSYVCDNNLKIIKEKFISDIANNSNLNSYYFTYMVQGSTVMINRKMVDFCVPFLEKTVLHDRYFHLVSEFFGKRIFINKSLMKYRQHKNNKIGAKSSNIKKIFTKRYFDTNDRELIDEIKRKYEKFLQKEKIKEINEYLEVTDITKNRFERFFLSKKFSMNIKKRIFLLLKG